MSGTTKYSLQSVAVLAEEETEGAGWANQGQLLEEEQFRSGRGKEGPRSKCGELGTVTLLGGLGHVRALLSLGLAMLP